MEESKVKILNIGLLGKQITVNKSTILNVKS